tara:strand:- start:27675 stop:28700 length:1026 start_codon:yes stop_codon:yes gene_type:complete
MFCHWVVVQFHHFMNWAFPHFMKFHDEAASVQHSHDMAYYVSLTWLGETLSFIGGGIASAFHWLFAEKLVDGLDWVMHEFMHSGIVGKIFIIIISLIVIFNLYLLAHFFIGVGKWFFRAYRNILRHAKHRYGTYWAVFRPRKGDDESKLSQRQQHFITVNPNTSRKGRFFDLFFIRQIAMVPGAAVLFLVVMASAYAIHYVGYVPFAFYAFAFTVFVYFKRNFKCTYDSMLYVTSIGVIFACLYMLYTNFDLGFHGYVIDAISYNLGLSEPIDFDPIIYTYFLYLAAFYLFRYLLYHFHVELVKIKHYKSRGIDLCAIYNAKAEKYAEEDKTKKSRKKIFK